MKNNNPITANSFFILFSFFLFTGCLDTGVDPPPLTLFSLSAEEIISTEALIKIESAHSDSVTVRLKRNGQTIVNNLRIYEEFVLNDTLLLPKQTYTYTAYKIENGNTVDSSQPLQLTTMDTTRNDFMWQTFTFGNGSSSVINDVAIISDTLIYAVGEIYILDSVGQNETMYNVAKWDGKKWNLKRIMIVSQQGNVHSRVFTGVYAFSATDVWFGDGNAFHWDGQDIFATAYWISGYPGNPTPVLGLNQGVSKFWGTSSSNLYGIGVNGGIAHYNGATWQKIESGTNLNMQDIWGVTKQNTSSVEIFCGATTLSETTIDTRLLKISSANMVDSLPWNSNWLISSVWTTNAKTLYLGSSTLLKYRDHIVQGKDFGRFISQVRGMDQNDIFISGSFGFLAHYNGSSWHEYFELLNNAIAYRSLSVNDNMVAAVGFEGDKAVATIGKRK